MRETEQSAPRWGLGDAVLGFVAGIVLSGVIASTWQIAHPDAKDLSLGGQGLAQIGLWIGLAGAVVLAARRKGSGSVREDFGFSFRPVDVPVGLACGVLGQVVVVPLVALLLRPLLGHPDISGPVQDLVDSATGAGAVGLFLFVVVGAPFVEELFFRGLVLRSLRRRFGPAPAVVVSSVLFGLAHPQDLPAGGQVLVMVSLMAFGAVLGVLAVRTRRLGPSIVTHAVFNAWTILFLLAR